MSNIGSHYKAQQIAQLIMDSHKTVVFTGAGVSTESGIPDFRSSGGLWDGKDPSKISHANMIDSAPGQLARFYADRIREFQSHKPNKAHHILEKWEGEGRVYSITTQNIDGYHKQAGSKRVHELHGNVEYLYCSHCLTHYHTLVYTEPDEEHGYSCLCSDENISSSQTGEVETETCGGFIRPNVTLFGEMLPDAPYHKALSDHATADLCIILGSSCSVHPANSLPQHTVTNGGKIVIVNKGETDLDYLATFKIDDWGIGNALQVIDQMMTKLL
jgi:NAD-dependent deacetylase